MDRQQEEKETIQSKIEAISEEIEAISDEIRTKQAELDVAEQNLQEAINAENNYTTPSSSDSEEDNVENSQGFSKSARDHAKQSASNYTRRLLSAYVTSIMWKTGALGRDITRLECRREMLESQRNNYKP